jgi:hypothetical protein
LSDGELKRRWKKWLEGDLLSGGKNSYLATLVERIHALPC